MAYHPLLFILLAAVGAAELGLVAYLTRWVVALERFTLAIDICSNIIAYSTKMAFLMVAEAMIQENSRDASIT